MNGAYFYEMANAQLNMKDRKIYLSTLTPEQRKDYDRYNLKVRQDKIKAKDENRLKYNEIRKDYITELRKAEPQRMKAQNIKDVQAFRERQKAQKEIINNKTKSINILTDAIKARKARAETKELKTKKQEEIKQKPKTKEEKKQETLRKKREYMRAYRAEQKAKAK